MSLILKAHCYKTSKRRHGFTRQKIVLDDSIVLTNMGSTLANVQANHMKLNLIRVLLLAFVVQTASLADAQPADGNHQADHVALRALRDKVVVALASQDMPMLTSCFAKDFAFTTVTQDVLTNETQVKTFFDRMFHGNDALVTSLKSEPKADILTRFLSENVGICYGSSIDTYTLKSGPVVQMNVRWSATVVKENGEWKVAMAHIGTDFLDNPVLDRVTSFWKRTLVITSTAGIVAGVISGWMLGRRRKVNPV
jgi:ketosteroid isomerase-like protein